MTGVGSGENGENRQFLEGTLLVVVRGWEKNGSSSRGSVRGYLGAVMPNCTSRLLPNARFCPIISGSGFIYLFLKYLVKDFLEAQV